jgi:hypothetical protein
MMAAHNPRQFVRIAGDCINACGRSTEAADAGGQRLWSTGACSRFQNGG